MSTAARFIRLFVPLSARHANLLSSNPSSCDLLAFANDLIGIVGGLGVSRPLSRRRCCGRARWLTVRRGHLAVGEGKRRHAEKDQRSAGAQFRLQHRMPPRKLVVTHVAPLASGEANLLSRDPRTR